METNKLQFPPIEKEGLRVLTTLQLAEAYGTNSKVISYNFNHNKEHFIEGVHYFRITGEELKNFCAFMNFTNANSNKIRELYLWTERGALLHAKSLNTEKAWEVYEFLIDTYYQAREIIASQNNAILEQQNEDKYSNFSISSIVGGVKFLYEEKTLLEQQMKNLNEKINILTEENKKLNERSQAYYKDIYFLKKEVKKLKEENREFNQICKKSQAKINFLKEDIKELKNENEKLNKKIKS